MKWLAEIKKKWVMTGAKCISFMSTQLESLNIEYYCVEVESVCIPDDADENHVASISTSM